MPSPREIEAARDVADRYAHAPIPHIVLEEMAAEMLEAAEKEREREKSKCGSVAWGSPKFLESHEAHKRGDNPGTTRYWEIPE